MELGSYDRAIAVTPDDSNNFAAFSRELYIGTAGTLKVTTAGGDVTTFANVGVGHLRLRVVRVWATGTTATGIVALA